MNPSPIDNLVALAKKATPGPWLTQDELKKLLHYDPLTGFFTWFPREGTHRAVKIWNTRYAWKRAGCAHKGYWVIPSLGLAGRLAVLYMKGEWPTHEVDHKDTNPLNNTWINLRLANSAQNKANCRKKRNNTSGFKGVCWSKAAEKWLAQIKVERKYIYLGMYDTPEQAHEAYCRAAIKHYGEFARFS